MKIKGIGIIVLFLLIFGPILSQKNMKEHTHKDWEIALAGGVVPLLLENEVSFGLHFHVLRRIEKIKKVRIGLGFENVFDEHTHINSSFLFNYEIYKGLNASVSPGILFLKEELFWHKKASLHIELAYEFEIKNFHLGPVIEYSYSSIDQHLMFGLHLGINF